MELSEAVLGLESIYNRPLSGDISAAEPFSPLTYYSYHNLGG
jgi:hypothetical protein